MIYKYRSFLPSYKYEVFTNGLVYFPKPSEFNDPFECKPSIKGIETLDERQKWAKRYIGREKGNLSHTKRNKMKRRILTRLTNPNNVLSDIHKKIDTYGIYSAAKKWDQCLMWSHYSDSHRGFCIGLEFNEGYDIYMGLSHEVVYSDSYPILTPDSFKENKENNTALLETTIATKSKEWSYEEEIRFIKIPADGGSKKYPIDKHNIKEVTFGACADKQNINELTDIIKEHTPWVKIYFSKLSSSKYELTRNEQS